MKYLYFLLVIHEVVVAVSKNIFLNLNLINIYFSFDSIIHNNDAKKVKSGTSKRKRLRDSILSFVRSFEIK